VVAFITIAVLSAAWWPRLGEAVLVAIGGGRRTSRSSGSDEGDSKPGE
jgi:hypothetical protein